MMSLVHRTPADSQNSPVPRVQAPCAIAILSRYPTRPLISSDVRFSKYTIKYQCRSSILCAGPLLLLLEMYEQIDNCTIPLVNKVGPYTLWPGQHELNKLTMQNSDTGQTFPGGITQEHNWVLPFPTQSDTVGAYPIDKGNDNTQLSICTYISKRSNRGTQHRILRKRCFCIIVSMYVFIKTDGSGERTGPFYYNHRF